MGWEQSTLLLRTLESEDAINPGEQERERKATAKADG